MLYSSSAEYRQRNMQREATQHAHGNATRTCWVSVVVPTYNRSAFLARCLGSLENQTISRELYEVIVVDDGSVDNTAEVCKAFAQTTSTRLIYLRGPHKGPAAARNLGIAEARGEIVAFIDDDCEASKDWLQQLSAPFGNLDIMGVEGKVVRHPDCTPFTHFVENLNGGLFLTANMAYRREMLRVLGGFDERYPHAAAEDWDLAFRVLDKGGVIAFHPEAVVVHSPVPVRGRHFMDRVTERRSAAMLYKRFPRYWQGTTGRTMNRSFAEGILMGPFVEVRKWRQYFSTHPSEVPRFLLWQLLASSRLLVEYVRLRHLGLA